MGPQLKVKRQAPEKRHLHDSESFQYPKMKTLTIRFIVDHDTDSVPFPIFISLQNFSIKEKIKRQNSVE